MATEQELQVFGWVAACVERENTCRVGSPTERDGRDGSALTIDATFEEAEPRLAVEVTRLRSDFEDPTSKHKHEFEARLRRYADEKGSPDWFIGVRPESSFKASLGPAVQRMMDWMLAFNLATLSPGLYSYDVPMDILQRMGDRFMHDCDQAKLDGVIMLRRETSGGIRVVPVMEFSDTKSLIRPLTRAFQDKAAALGVAKARGYVTMLAVDVEREDAVAYLQDSVIAPDFVPEIDHLWLFVRKSPGGELRMAFHAKQDDRRLKRLDLPAP